MARRNYYRMVVTNEYLGLSKEITAPSRYELDIKVNNQMRIWDEKAQRAIDKDNVSNIIFYNGIITYSYNDRPNKNFS